MLEGLAAWVLNNYLGKYVENLNTDQLSIGLLKGEVELDYLPLKKDALNSLDQSIEIRAGFLGKVHLKIPVTRLLSEPWVISIEQLYIVAGPILSSDYDEEKEKQASHERKMSKLDLMEAKWRSEHEAKQETSYYASSYSSWVSYGTSFASTIVENLQLKIKNVHIRFEDNFSNPNTPFAWGIMIKSLVAQNTNENGQTKTTGQDDRYTKKKLVELQDFSIYWDLNAIMVGFLPMQELADAMQKMLLQNTGEDISNKKMSHEYILEPVSAQASLRRNCECDSLRSRSSPRYVCNLVLDMLPVIISEAQHESIVTWIYEFERLNKVHKYRKWRPQECVHGHAREWWYFAVQPHIHAIRQKRMRESWSYVLQRAKDNVKYVKSYSEHLINPASLPAALKNHKDLIELENEYEELKILRQVAIQKVEEEIKAEKMKREMWNSAGILQRWFPLWGGWYQSSNEVAGNAPKVEMEISTTEDDQMQPELLNNEHNLEEEILDALRDCAESDTLFRRDAVFAKVNFTLKRSIFTISSNESRRFSRGASPNSKSLETTKNVPLFELGFDDVLIGLEMRPRTKSTMFEIKLGALYLEDKIVEGSQFPRLIAPQVKEAKAPPSLSMASTIASKLSLKSFPWNLTGGANITTKPKENPLFQLTYETKPFNSTADLKLHIKSQSLDIIYNATAFQRIAEFFTTPYQKYNRMEQLSAAKIRYEEFKRQTKDEIMKNCDHIFHGSEMSSKLHWDVQLDISAPQIVFPENFFDVDTTIVVFDFGRFQFRTNSSNVKEKSPSNIADSDDEDVFKTPCSTPPSNIESPVENTTNFLPTLSVIKEGLSVCDITEYSLHNRMYDRYYLDLSDLQILVCKAKNNWKYAYVQGTSTMHVLDRFSISLQLERRIVHTMDPLWPNVTLTGTLPKLIVHVNEQKVQALKTCLSQHNNLFQQLFSPNEAKRGKDPSTVTNRPSSDNLGSDLEDNSEQNTLFDDCQPAYNAESRLLMMQFNIKQMCLDVQSRGRSIAELQVTEIKSTFMKRPIDTSITLTVHSLLLVDALQTFGRDFELLVASHKNIGMDSISGSIRDSEPNSPSSPASPTASYMASTSPVAINAALKNLQINDIGFMGRASPPLMNTTVSLPYLMPDKHLDVEALIMVELTIINPPMPLASEDKNSSEITKIATIQFNNLDIIANQETLVELLGFLKQIIPTTSHSTTSQAAADTASAESSELKIDRDEFMELAENSTTQVELTFDFNRLNILLLRSIERDGALIAQKVATATMTGACIHATISSSSKMHVSLGGLQIFDLVPEGGKHSRILSVGYDPFAESAISLVDQLKADLYRSSQGSMDEEEKHAFHFLVKWPDGLGYLKIPSAKTASLELHMASVCYVHSARFLKDLASCASDFKQYTANFANSLKSAAVEVAEGIFSGGKRTRVQSNFQTSPSTPIKELSIDDAWCEKQLNISLDILLESPVIIVPESPESSNVLVAHLGKITIKNERSGDNEPPSLSHAKLIEIRRDKSQRISIEIREMNLHSWNIDNELSMQKPMGKPRYLYNCLDKGFPILHDTAIELHIDHWMGNYILHSQESAFVNERQFRNDNRTKTIFNIFNIHGSVITPLKVSLTKKHYRQILKTVDYLTNVNENSNKELPKDASGARTDHLSQLNASRNRKSEICISEQATPHSNSNVSTNFVIKTCFCLPEFVVELFQDYPNLDHGLVSLTFMDFLLYYEKQDDFFADIEITLKSIKMEDLFEDPGSKHRYLMFSFSPDDTPCPKPPKSKYLSSSCPDISKPSFVLKPQCSLPDKLNTESMFHNLHRIKEKKMYGGYFHNRATSLHSLTGSCPCTPPPSPQYGKQEILNSASDALVHIKILLVQPNNDEFTRKYNSTDRFVDINFNCLDTIVNLRSWNMVLDFFGIKDIGESRRKFSDDIKCDHGELGHTFIEVTSAEATEEDLQPPGNMEMEIQVRSLSLILKKKDYEITKANISNFFARVERKQDSFSVKGKVGDMSLLDLTPYGELYRERFTTVGSQALHFEYLYVGNYDTTQSREYDASLKLDMASVRYVHTNRFYTETFAFLQQLYKVENSRTMPRVLLEIHIDSPVIAIPVSSWSNEVLVANLGQLRVNNRFLNAGTDGTISVVQRSFNNGLNSFKCRGKHDIMNQPVYGSLENALSDVCYNEMCLLDVISIKLTDIDLHVAERQPRNSMNKSQETHHLIFSTFVIRKRGIALLTDKCKLDLQMERNLERETKHSVADVSICGTLSKLHCLVDKSQYTVVRGVFEHNLGEPLDDLQLEESYLPQTHPKEKATLNEFWMELSLHFDLVNVTLEFLECHALSPTSEEKPLAKVNFIKSKLTYERSSNQSRDIDLVSQEILVSDTRFRQCPANARPNVFYNILQPTKDSQENFLQAELHYRVSRDVSRVTVLLNNMQLIAVFDWWTAVLGFLGNKIKYPNKGNPNGQTITVKPSTTSKYAYSALTGVATKRGPVIDTNESPFELKINVTETAIVVVEDTSAWDSSAIILKSTAVVTHRPLVQDKPLSCSLQRLEIFSCILGLEDDTALSIVDPVTLNMEIVAQKQAGESIGLSDLVSIEKSYTFELSMQDLIVRLSYHDMQLFLRILAGYTTKTGTMVAPNESQVANTMINEKDRNITKMIGQLESMGFRQGDCLKALQVCKGDLNDAALWLTQNAISEPIENCNFIPASHENAGSSKWFAIKAVKFHATNACVCIIDDCKDADVPLFEINLTELNIFQTFGTITQATACFDISIDFYNRSLSGWEPLIEPWKCLMEWNFKELCNQNESRLSIAIKGEEVLDLNITSTLVDICQSVKTNWTEDYYNQSSRDRATECLDMAISSNDRSSLTGGVYAFKRRSPFVPFALKNSTGCELKFTTITVNSDQLFKMDYEGGSSALPAIIHNWLTVAPNEVIPFKFEGRLKLRHQDTHEFKVHQLIICIDGWQQVAPVSVDKVGIFFRDAKPQISHQSGSKYIERPSVRVVFSVTLEGSARKLVTVRSAIVLINRLESILEVKLDDPYRFQSSTLVHLAPSRSFPIPLPYVMADILVRPAGGPNILSYSPAIQWQIVTKPDDIQEATYHCVPMPLKPNLSNFRFCARVHRENYPLDMAPMKNKGATHFQVNFAQPAHAITFIPPVILVNLLPYELSYEVRSCKDVQGRIKPGSAMAIHLVDLSSSFEVRFSFESFTLMSDLIVPANSSGFETVLRAVDIRERILLLQARGVGRNGGHALKISISSPYCIINKTGMPLIFRQENVQAEAAGQFSEHEMARSVIPLLFSFADRDAPSWCSMRVGKSVHPDGEPKWCHYFHLQKGVQFRRLQVMSCNRRPNWVYSIGIEVRVGSDIYSDIHFVTLTPRFQLNNHSSHKLEFTQKYALTSGNLEVVRLSALPKCLLPFHWPRLDMDQLLCVRMSDVIGCSWSGGFQIERISSFHINMRDASGKPMFLRIEIVSQGATFFVVFTDADKMPPPFRIDNMSEVQLTCHQAKVDDERMWISVRPHASVPYALDEPTLPPLINCMVPGGCSETYNLNDIGESKHHLSYENFIYITFTETFSSCDEVTRSVLSIHSNEYQYRELVLDVPDGGLKVILSPKEPGKRSQLWRMTSTGMLQHEGSSPPRSRSRKLEPHFHSSEIGLVLDIAGIAPLPDTYASLRLRKPDPRRGLTQTWEFTDDGRLCLKLNNLYVQSKDGFQGLKAGNEVVIGPSQPVLYATNDRGIPIEQSISRQRLWPGSGVLGVKIVHDGPTRVLRVVDIRQKSLAMHRMQSGWTIVDEKFGTNYCEINKKESDTVQKIHQFQVKVTLPRGLGISLVNYVPEELIYARFINITLEFTKSPTELSLDGSVKAFQVDNQLAEAECAVLLHISPMNKYDNQRHLPAIYVGFSRTTSHHANVDIFKSMMVTIKNVTMQMEERLLWKLLQFISRGDKAPPPEGLDESTHERQRFLLAESVALAKRYYFTNLELSLNQVRLSMITSSKLTSDLKDIKKQAGLPLIRFEDALVELDPFVRSHLFETRRFLLNSIIGHYREELKGQAAKILGAVDFLGNPLGLVNDVTEGLSEFINDGNVGSLLKNVTHGLSNSAAKFTGTLSDGLGVVTMDEKHQMIRKKIRADHGSGSGEQLVAGFKGLGYGIYSGVTSIVTQTYEGAATEGIQGFFSGLGKGLVGTITKPAVGVLDLATSAASAVRDTSRSNYHTTPPSLRLRRLCIGPRSLLPKYSADQSTGQALLYNINNNDYAELFIALEILSYSQNGLCVLISSNNVYFLSQEFNVPTTHRVLTVTFRELYHCKIVSDFIGSKIAYYLELTIKPHQPSGVSSANENYKKPRVLCDSETKAHKVTRQINYAKGLYDEMVHTLISSKENAETS